MSITIELSPEVEQALRADAEAQGVDAAHLAALRIENSYSSLEPEAVEAVLEALAQPEAGDLSQESFIAKRADWRRNRNAEEQAQNQQKAA